MTIEEAVSQEMVPMGTVVFWLLVMRMKPSLRSPQPMVITFELKLVRPALALHLHVLTPPALTNVRSQKQPLMELLFSFSCFCILSAQNNHQIII